MTVEELRNNLDFYDDDAEVVFELDDDVDVEATTVDKWGNTSVRIDSKLKEDFICDIAGDMVITLVTRKE